MVSKAMMVAGRSVKIYEEIWNCTRVGIGDV
jgi:hypothetical protein